MVIDTAFWRDLEAQFRALPDPIRLTAMWSDRRCGHFGGPSDNRQRERLYALYRALATRAGIATGANRANAFDAWLNLLREESLLAIIRKRLFLDFGRGALFSSQAA